MKKIIVILALLAMLYACPPVNPPEPEPTQTPEPIITPDPISPTDQPTGPVKFALYDGQTLRFWDGVNLFDGYTGDIKVAGSKKLSIGNVLYYFDDYGNSVFSRWLPDTPDAILAVPTQAKSKEATVYEDDVYTLIDIPPSEAYAMGALPRHYTRVFVNGTEIGQWNYNEWEVSSVIETASGHILAYDSLGRWHNLTDSKTVSNAYENGIMIYNVNESNYTAFISDDTGEYAVSWSNGYLNIIHARWQKAGDSYYSENGFVWESGSNQITSSTVLYNWNEYANFPESYTDNAVYGENPYLLPSGVREENGEEVTYWIETVTGIMYRHVPSIDQMDYFVKLYEGTGYRMGAIPYFNSLEPEIVENNMMFHDGEMIRQCDLTNRIISQFGPNQELIVWE